MEVIVLKMREADEIDAHFGYNELIISAALAKYGIETAPEFEDIRNRLNAVTMKLFNPAGAPGGAPPAGF
jgi:hypothetical protein